MGNFRTLKVWQVSKQLAVEIYEVTKNGGFERDFRFNDQIRSAAVSVPSNIAEGDELQSNKQSVKFFYIAKGSTAEILTQLEIAQEIGYITEVQTKELLTRYEHVSHMLAKLIITRKSQPKTQ